MEGTLQFLLIAGIIVIGIVKQFKKEAKKNADNAPAVPMPETEMDNDTIPIPDIWGKTYGGYIPEGPVPEPQPESIPPVKEVTKKQTYSSSKTFLPGESRKKSAYTPVFSAEQEASLAASMLQAPETESEYAIHSAEEARKAIIWSEILQRKY